MSYERDRALGQYTVLKEKIYRQGIKAQSLVDSINDEMNAFALSEKDFTDMDFKKVETLVKELQQLQTDYIESVVRMKKLKETYNF